MLMIPLLQMEVEKKMKEQNTKVGLFFQHLKINVNQYKDTKTTTKTFKTLKE